jgi:hypothetical protein
MFDDGDRLIRGCGIAMLYGMLEAEDAREHE